MPAITAHPGAELMAVCGRRADATRRFAAEAGIERWFTDPPAMLAEVGLDGVVVATANDSHHDLTMAALDAGIHALCEKPLALDVAQARAMRDRAAQRGLITMVPFTYRYMPVNRWVKQLVETGFVGRPFHVSLRYYTGFALDDRYSWRFDRALAGTGVIGDLGAHWIDLSRWLLDEPERSVSAVASTFVERQPRPDGSDYDRLEDSVVMTVRYLSGAYAVLQASAVCWEGTAPFGQTHHLEIHGDGGTLYATCDWDTVQEVRGVRRGETGGPRPLPIPDDIWGGVRRDRVHDTYRDVFRTTDAMTRGWISAIADGRPIRPDFDDGLAVQRVVDSAAASAAEGGTPVDIDHDDR